MEITIPPPFIPPEPPMRKGSGVIVAIIVGIFAYMAGVNMRRKEAVFYPPDPIVFTNRGEMTFSNIEWIQFKAAK